MGMRLLDKYRNTAFAILTVIFGLCFFKACHILVRPPHLREEAILTYAPQVPPAITRRQPAVVVVRLTSGRTTMKVDGNRDYEYWTFNNHVPGPFIRVRVGDILEIHHTGMDMTGMPHNIDLHAVSGPGGGAPVTTAVNGQTVVARFKMLHPGLYMYHCAAPPVMDHIADGMFGLILVEPEKGLSPVDHEFYVVQSEIYARPADNDPESEHLIFSPQDGLDEHPLLVVFNGKVGSMMGEGALKARVGQRVRIFFCDAGPNLISSFHIIGTIFENVYREGGLVSPPEHYIQTTVVPAGGATVVEFKLEEPGNYTLVDHAIFRIGQGAMGIIKVDGTPNYDIYSSDQDIRMP